MDMEREQVRPPLRPSLSSSRAWLFSRGLWEPTTLPVQESDFDDEEEMIHAMGYAPEGHSWGIPLSGCFLEMHRAIRDNAPYLYFAVLELGADLEWVFIPDFPSVFMLLRDIGGALQSSLFTWMEEEQQEKK